MTLTTTPRAANAADEQSSAVSHWTGADLAGPWLATASALAPALRAAAERHDRDNTFVDDEIAALRSSDLLAMLVPADLGGGGATLGDVGAVLAELARACPATALTFSMHQHVLAAQVWRHRRGLPAPVLTKVVNDRVLLVSTGASDWLASNGQVTSVDGGYRVTARKMPASGCLAGTIVASSARWDDAPGGPQVLHFAIPFATEGVSIEPTWDTLGMRGTGSHTVVFDDVVVPEEAVSLMRPADVWHPVWATVVGVALPLIMAVYVGVAEAAVDAALPLARPRRGRPGVAAQTGRMLTDLTIARDTVRAMLDHAGDLSFDPTPEHASMSLTRKVIATDACLATVRTALDLGGGAAYGRTEIIERLFRDVHAAVRHPLPAPEQQEFTGRLALGEPPV